MNSEKVKNTKEHPNDKIAEALKLVNEAKSEKLKEAKSQLSSFIEEGQVTFDDYKNTIQDGFKQSTNEARKRVKNKPLQYVVGAGVLGLVVGFLFARNK